MRIRSRLLIVVLAVLVPAFVGAALGIGYIYTEAQQSLRQSMRETTRALAIVLDKEIAKREGILRALAASPALDNDDFETFHKQARAIAPNWDVSIVLVDLSGQQFLNSRMPFGTKGLPKYANHELREQYGPEATIVSNLYMAPIGKSYSFSIQIPVKRDNRVLYYIATGSFAHHMQTVFEEQQMPNEWIGTIVDRNGRVVARSREPEKYVGTHATGPIMEKMKTTSEGFNEGTALSGEPVVGFFSTAPQSQWTFVVSVPQREMNRTAIRASALMGVISLLLLGLAVAGALAVGRNTARPIEALRRAAERLGRGELIKAEPSGIMEIDAVGAAMVQAGDEIRSGKAELERRVEVAVAAAERSQRALLQGQKMEALGRLTGGIAHDFNNVLQTLTTGLDVALISSTEPRVKSSLEACQRAVQRATELTRQMMAFGRVQDARLETVDLARQIAAMTPLLKGALRSDIEFRLDVADRLWPVTIDPLQFELALLNLTINARDAMPRGGPLTLQARNETVDAPLGELAPGDYVRVCVIDAGGGMSQEVLAKAFDPFFTTKSVGKGSGLGLPQAYAFAKQSGGALILHSKPGDGTSAMLYLPKSDRPLPPPQPDKNVLQRAASDAVVLFVEDDPLVRDVAAPALEAAGFGVKTANNGEEAVALLEAGGPIDLVFSDIVMPGRISGVDLAGIIRKRFPRIRVVLATGYSERRVDVPGIQILAKPYEVAQVVNALQEELQMQGSS